MQKTLVEWRWIFWLPAFKFWEASLLRSVQIHVSIAANWSAKV